MALFAVLYRDWGRWSWGPNCANPLLENDQNLVRARKNFEAFFGSKVATFGVKKNSYVSVGGGANPALTADLHYLILRILNFVMNRADFGIFDLFIGRNVHEDRRPMPGW